MALTPVTAAWHSNVDQQPMAISSLVSISSSLPEGQQVDLPSAKTVEPLTIKTELPVPQTSSPSSQTSNLSVPVLPVLPPLPPLPASPLCTTTSPSLTNDLHPFLERSHQASYGSLLEESKQWTSSLASSLQAYSDPHTDSYQIRTPYIPCSTPPHSLDTREFGIKTIPLTLQERRQRNKIASAKYRAKKNQQYDQMRNRIVSLGKDNGILRSQLNHIRNENARLRDMCSRLRGRKTYTGLPKQSDTQQDSSSTT